MSPIHGTQIRVQRTETLQHVCGLLEIVNVLKRAETYFAFYKIQRFPTLSSTFHRIQTRGLPKLDSSEKTDSALNYQLAHSVLFCQVDLPRVHNTNLKSASFSFYFFSFRCPFQCSLIDLRIQLEKDFSRFA